MIESIANKYKVIRELGEGSSGKVYLVQHPDLNVRYALKLLNHAVSNDNRFIEQFKREAEVLLRFSHEGCVQLRDFGRLDSGLYFMATDYCDGGTLKDLLLRTGRLDPKYALLILSQLLAVLGAAHQRGIVHRDIKPENIMIERDYKGRDVVKVLDFGVAKLFDMGLQKEEGSVGTPAYMSPEQGYGEKDLDGRTDIYAAGIVAYEMLTGRPPFQGDSVLQTLLMHITQPIEPFAEQLKLPLEVEALIFKALEKNRMNRYEKAELFASQCAAVLSLLSTQPERTPDEYVEPLEAKIPVKEESSPEDPPKLLCLDDDERLLDILRHILEREGFEVFTSTSCDAIHSYLFTHDVKLLITDVQMPQIPGQKVCKMLKESISDLKILLFSNLPERELEKLQAESGADGWLSKSTRPAQWIEKVKEIVAG